jgi:hypothetical protein
VTSQQTFVALWQQNFCFRITSIQTEVFPLHLMDADDIGATI